MSRHRRRGPVPPRRDHRRRRRALRHDARHRDAAVGDDAGDPDGGFPVAWRRVDLGAAPRPLHANEFLGPDSGLRRAAAGQLPRLGPWKEPQGSLAATKRSLPKRCCEPVPQRVGMSGSRSARPASWRSSRRSCFVPLTASSCRWAARAGRGALRGFSTRCALWTALLVSGGMRWFAGAMEAAGPLRHLTPNCRPATASPDHRVLCRRVDPVGRLFAGVLLSILLIAASSAQSRLGCRMR